MKSKAPKAAISDASHDPLVVLKYERLKLNVQIGFDALDRREFSDKTFEDIAVDALSEFKQRAVGVE